MVIRKECDAQNQSDRDGDDGEQQDQNAHAQYPDASCGGKGQSQGSADDERQDRRHHLSNRGRHDGCHTNLGLLATTLLLVPLPSLRFLGNRRNGNVRVARDQLGHLLSP